MMGVNIGLILLACVLVCSGRSVFNDKCTLMPNPGPSAGTTMDAETNKDCLEGSVWWNYPQGNLRVHFKQNSPSAIFKLCLLEEGSYLYFNKIIKEHTGAVVEKPTADSDSCVDSEEGEVTLRFESGTAMYYMALVNYEIRQP